jgi:integrase
MGITKTLHGLRSFRACRLYEAGFDDGAVADEMGWSLNTVRHIRLHYVDQEALFAGRAKRLQNQSGLGGK